MKKYMKPSEYAKIYSMNQRTVVNNFHKGLIKGKQNDIVFNNIIEKTRRLLYNEFR